MSRQIPPSNFYAQRIHISPNELGRVHTSTFTDDSATTERDTGCYNTFKMKL